MKKGTSSRAQIFCLTMNDSKQAYPRSFTTQGFLMFHQCNVSFPTGASGTGKQALGSVQQEQLQGTNDFSSLLQIRVTEKEVTRKSCLRNKTMALGKGKVRPPPELGGKTSVFFSFCKALGWREIQLVDIYMCHGVNPLLALSLVGLWLFSSQPAKQLNTVACSGASPSPTRLYVVRWMPGDLRWRGWAMDCQRP
eukprot:1157750-Pelagomonas_calceolata.AAC.8